MINDTVAIDAGSLALSCSEIQRESVRDIVMTHAHLDHVAGLPLFIDDLFSTLTSPIRVHACSEVIDALESHIFNWSIYPRFSELANANGKILEYYPIEDGVITSVGGLDLLPIPVNHKVPTSGFLISDNGASIAFTGDTSVMSEFWTEVNKVETLGALLIECAFPDSLDDLAEVSHHLTPRRLRTELGKFHHSGSPIFVINMKPMFREVIAREIDSLGISNLHIFEPGRIYEF